MSGNEQQQQRLTARHEAGHAIAAFHYGCPLLWVSIDASGDSLGAARIAEPEVPQDAVVIFCGPLAEHDWAKFHPGANHKVEAVGTDLAGLNVLQQRYGDLTWYYTEALLFLSNPTVQQEVDRLAEALLAQKVLTADEARAAAQFTGPIMPAEHQ